MNAGHRSTQAFRSEKTKNKLKEIFDETHTDSTKVVRAQGGTEASAAYKFGKDAIDEGKSKPFNFLSNLIRYSVLKSRGGLYVNSDIGPGSVRLAELPEIHMRRDDVPFFAPRIRDRKGIDETLAGTSDEGETDFNERVRKAVERLYNRGQLNNNLILAPADSELVGTILDATPLKFEQWLADLKKRYGSATETEIRNLAAQDIAKQSPHVSGPGLIGDPTGGIPEDPLLDRHAMKLGIAKEKTPGDLSVELEPSLHRDEVKELFQPELLDSFKGLRWLTEESDTHV